MGQPESRLSGRILRELKLQGIFAFKQHGSEFTMAGLPDIIACVEGIWVGFEVKMPGKYTNTSPTQKLVHGMIRDSGGLVWVVCSTKEAMYRINEVRGAMQQLGYSDMSDRLSELLKSA